jgi:hypothetical protein
MYLIGFCKEMFGIESGGGDKTHTHSCLVTRVGDWLFGWLDIFVRIIFRFILGRHIVRKGNESQLIVVFDVRPRLLRSESSVTEFRVSSKVTKKKTDSPNRDVISDSPGLFSVISFQFEIREK